MIRHGATAGRVELDGRRGAVPVAASLSASRDEPKRAPLDGAVLRSAEQLRRELATLVFTPDRLAVVKGGPGRAAGVLRPRRSAGSTRPARTCRSSTRPRSAQRNAALRRVAAGVSDADALEPWTAQVAELGAQLVAARPRRRRAAAAGLRRACRRARPRRTPRSATTPSRRRSRALDERLAARPRARHDRRSGRTSTRSGSAAGDRDLRDLRLAGRAADGRAVAAPRRGGAARRAPRVPPLLLLDDALSELDASRRRTLSERLGAMGQTLVTATGAEALPLAPGAALRVTPAGSSGLMERLDGAVRRALRGAGVPDAGALAAVTRRGPSASATRSPARRGRSGSPATARCTSPRSPRPGRSSSAGWRRRSSRSSPPRSATERRPRSGSRPARCPRRRRRSAAAAATAPPEVDDATRQLAERADRRDRATTELRETIRRAAAASLAKAAPAAVSDTLQ